MIKEDFEDFEKILIKYKDKTKQLVQLKKVFPLMEEDLIKET